MSFQFSLRTFLVAIASTTLSLALLVRFQLDILLPMLVAYGCVGGVMIARWNRPHASFVRMWMHSSIGAATGSGLAAFILGLFSPPHGQIDWSMFLSVGAFVYGIIGGLAVNVILVGVILFWQKWIARLPGWVGLALLGVVLVLIIYMVPWPYRAAAYTGDGTMVDNGIWGFPRYEIRLDDIPLTEIGTYRFAFSGLPPIELTLEMRNDMALTPDVLRGLSTSIDVKLIDDSKRLLSDSTVPLEAWGYQYAPGLPGVRLFHPDISNLKLRSSRNYTLELRVHDIDTLSPAPPVTLFLTGGGSHPL